MQRSSGSAMLLFHDSQMQTLQPACALCTMSHTLYLLSVGGARQNVQQSCTFCVLQIALEALLKAFSPTDWLLTFSNLAAKVAEVGPSHRAHLVALKLLPVHIDSGYSLHQAAAALMLQDLCKMPSKVWPRHWRFLTCNTDCCTTVLQMIIQYASTSCCLAGMLAPCLHLPSSSQLCFAPRKDVFTGKLYT